LREIHARAYLLLFAFLYLPYVYFNHSDGWNQGARFAQLHAVVMQGTLQIDKYHEPIGDKAFIDGHYYSEKAPAIALLALPAFAATVAVQKWMGVDPDTQPGWRWSEWITTAGSVAILAALGGVAFFALLQRRLGAGIALVATIALFLGTITWPYATALFAHAGTIGLLAIVLWSVLARSASTRKTIIGGLCAGLAVAGEYPAIFPCGVLGLYLLVRDYRRALLFAASALPALLVVLINNALSTGSPFTLAYGSNALFPEISSSNFFGFNLPSGRALRGLLWGEYRGLLFWSPVMLMALPGLVFLWRTNRILALAIAVATVVTLIQASSFSGWTGGSSLGPRYLTPAIPMLALAAAYGIARFPRTGAALTVISVVIMATATAIAIDPPDEVLRPVRDWYFVRMGQERWATNLGMLVGLSPIASWLALAAIEAPIGWLLIKETAAMPAGHEGGRFSA
jgi:hypothetical protein